MAEQRKRNHTRGISQDVKIPKQYETRSTTEVFTDVENVTNKLLGIPELIDLIIESFKLDELEWEKWDMWDFMARRDILCKLIYMVLNGVDEVNEGINAIQIRKPIEEEGEES